MTRHPRSAWLMRRLERQWSFGWARSAARRSALRASLECRREWPDECWWVQGVVGADHYRTPMRPPASRDGSSPESAQGLLNDVGKDRMIDRCQIVRCQVARCQAFRYNAVGPNPSAPREPGR